MTLELPADERQTVQACLRQVDFLTGEITAVDQQLATAALDSQEIKRLMTIPGVDITTAATLMAAIGEISRFPNDRQLAGYLGLDARVRQSGNTPARHGRISKQGSSAARHVLVEAAWAAIKTPGPLRAFYQRIRARRGPQIAIVAIARKLAALSWQLLTKEEDYAFKRSSLVEKKLRAIELRAGAPSRQGAPGEAARAPVSAPYLSGSSPSRPNKPTCVSSTTRKRRGQQKAVRAPHRGAHLKGPRRAKPRGGPRPQYLRFRSRSPAPHQASHQPPTSQAQMGLDFHP